MKGFLVRPLFGIKLSLAIKVCTELQHCNNAAQSFNYAGFTQEGFARPRLLDTPTQSPFSASRKSEYWFSFWVEQFGGGGNVGQRPARELT